MKTFTKISSGLVLGLLIMSFASCKKDEVIEPEVKAELKVNKVPDLDAKTDTVFYSMTLHEKVQKKEAWDLRFTSRSITASGSAQVVSGVFNSYNNAPTSGYVTGNITDWYSYNQTNHIISIVPGKIIIVKTKDGKYAKVEMLVYYKGNPTITSTSSYKDVAFKDYGHYTFNYVYQPDGSTNLK